jgi:hypothetical protein
MEALHHTINVRADISWEPVNQKSSISPGKEDREFLVKVSGSFTLLLPSLPGLGRGQLLHLGHSLCMPAPKSLPMHGDKHYPLPPPCLASLSHLPTIGRLQGMASFGGDVPDQLSLKRVNDSHVQGCVPTPVRAVCYQNISRSSLSVPSARPCSRWWPQDRQSG